MEGKDRRENKAMMVTYLFNWIIWGKGREMEGFFFSFTGKVEASPFNVGRIWKVDAGLLLVFLFFPFPTYSFSPLFFSFCRKKLQPLFARIAFVGRDSTFVF